MCLAKAEKKPMTFDSWLDEILEGGDEFGLLGPKNHKDPHESQLGIADKDSLELLPTSSETTEPKPRVKTWRDEPEEHEIPKSLDEILNSPLAKELYERTTGIAIYAPKRIRHVTQSKRRRVPDYIARPVRCLNFEHARELFDNVRLATKSGKLNVKAIKTLETFDVDEGSLFTFKGLLVCVAYKPEMKVRNGRRDCRLRVFYSNGKSNDPLLSSFRNALRKDKTAQVILGL
jgi:hypothetical protein